MPLDKIANIIQLAETHRLTIDEPTAQMIASDCVVAIGVSGGKDSDAAAILTNNFLNDVGHQGARVLIHADLGQIEHNDSLPQCRRLGERVGMELIVVRRKQGDMLDRWEQRWHDNLTRYHHLETVSLLSPWSSAQWRFCTSELKISPITQELTRRFPGQQILNVVGLRRNESASRAKRPISQENPRLKRADGTSGRDWFPILDWQVHEVFSLHEQYNFPLHPAYTQNGNSRVSCSFCVLSSLHDLHASLKDEGNDIAYRRIVALEAKSTFSFQPNRWLGDVEPERLTPEMRQQLIEAKQKAIQRKGIEATLAPELRFKKGTSTTLPTREQCEQLALARQQIGRLLQLDFKYQTVKEIMERYVERQRQEAQKQRAIVKVQPVVQAEFAFENHH